MAELRYIFTGSSNSVAGPLLVPYALEACYARSAGLICLLGDVERGVRRCNLEINSDVDR